MRTSLYALIAVTIAAAGPAAALHEDGNPPGQIAKKNETIPDRNGNGRANGGDYAPGYSASIGADRNGDDKTNGRDYAPGQHED